MCRLKNETFAMLQNSGIFKANFRTGKCSEKTSQRRFERDRSRMAWISVDTTPLSHTGLRRGRVQGTYERAKHGVLR